MGWCSGTEIFDKVVKVVLSSEISEHAQFEIIAELYRAMCEHDWDCEGDSAYIEHPIVKRAMQADLPKPKNAVKQYRLEYSIDMDRGQASGGRVKDFEAKSEAELFKQVLQVHRNYGILHELYQIGDKGSKSLLSKYHKWNKS